MRQYPNSEVPTDWAKHRLPHRNIGALPVHIVYRLKDSIPQVKLKKVLAERELIYGSNSKNIDGDEVGDISTKKEWTEIQFENLLHNYSNGPYHLKQPALAKIVIDSWLWFQTNRELYIYAICVMSNHVHVLLQSRNAEIFTIGKIMKAHKNFTATMCNRVMGTVGRSFWEAGYFDRDLRPNQFTTLMWYILNNPVKAGLVEHWQEWKGTYLHPDYRALFGQ